jgi:hypothetical protein
MQALMTRQILPNRREHEIFDIEHDGQHHTIGVGRFEDGRPAELFINSAKFGTAADINARDAAILTSLLLQNGHEITTIIQSLHRNSDGNPKGLISRVLRLISGGA